MINNCLRHFAVLVMLSVTTALNAQGSAEGGKSATAKNSYPESFRISTTELAQVVAKKEKEMLALPGNPYLNQALVLRAVANGDMHFTRLQLAYFKGGYLHVQVNGTASTQIFLFSEDKRFFYKSSPLPDGYLLSRCAEDEIVSE